MGGQSPSKYKCSYKVINHKIVTHYHVTGKPKIVIGYYVTHNKMVTVGYL